MKKVLIMEDELNIRSFVVINLKRAGYDVIEAGNGQEALDAIAENPDAGVVILDIMVPGDMDGFEVCRRIRANNKQLGIIMLTARTQEMDKVTGLMTGADDYVTKPFSINVLLARIKANLRRSANEVVTGDSKSDTVLKIRDLVIDNEKYQVTKAGVMIALSKIEYDLLSFLAANQGKPFKREELLESVWGYKEFFGDKRTVDVTVSRLRNKIEADPTHPEYIFSKHGYGYYLA